MDWLSLEICSSKSPAPNENIAADNAAADAAADATADGAPDGAPADAKGSHATVRSAATFNRGSVRLIEI